MTQTLLNAVPVDAMSEDVRQAWTALNELTGNARFVEVFANAPELLEFVMQQFYGQIFFGGRLDQRYKQLARLRLSLVHGCRTCNLQNRPGAREAGLSEEQIAALASNDPTPFDEAERAVLEFANLMALDNQTRLAGTELMVRLKRHFSAAQICELGVVTAVICGMAKLSFVLDLVDREPYCAFN